MKIFNEEILKEYAKPLSETEENKCKNAIRMVANALEDLNLKQKDIKKIYDSSTAYQIEMYGTNYYDYKIKIFLQGSYANNTNVRTHSDIDIAIVQEDTFIPKFRSQEQEKHYIFGKPIYRERSFKDEVEYILKKHFKNDVERKNKSIKINGNSYRKDTDTVPAMRLKNFENDYIFNENNYIGGILIKADDGKKIINYPEQHIKNGVEKNKRTNHYFKKMVRIGKELRYQMEELNYEYASKASSFGVECLIWNVPDYYFTSYESYCYTFKKIIDYLYENRYNIDSFMEVNNIKKLCEDSSDKSKIYIKFIEELKGFYTYE